MIAPGRWHPAKTAMVYCADHPATALLEILVHLDPEDAPETFQLLEIDVPDAAAIQTPELPETWAQNEALTKRLGSQFIAAMTHPVMKVPCAIVPFTSNYLLNAELLETTGIRIVGITRHPIDIRLLT